MHLWFWKLYVNDTCMDLPADSVQGFLEHLTNVEPSIHFTVEMELKGKLLSLDVRPTIA